MNWTFEDLNRAQLERLAEAGNVVRETEALMRKQSTNPVHLITEGAESFEDGQHFPENDIFDPESHSQYYFHAHRQEAGEVGHFHCFMRHGGLDRSLTPYATQPTPSEKPDDDWFAHLVALSVDGTGKPIQLFTTNRWVTHEMLFPANDILDAVDRFTMTDTTKWSLLNRWITAMIALFRPQIGQLVLAREETFRRWARVYGTEDRYECEALEVTSMVPVNVEHQIGYVAGLLAE